MFTSVNFYTASESISVKLRSSLTELVSETALKPVITFSTPACQKLHFRLYFWVTKHIYK